jgi:hypothetical protein
MKIYKNAVSPTLFKRVQQEILAGNVPWYFSDFTAYENIDNEVMDYSWFHIVSQEGSIGSQIAQLIESALIGALDSVDESIEVFTRIRIGLLTATHTPIQHEPHTDWQEQHKTGILYINDSDGDTIIYNEKYNLDSGVTSKEYKDKINLTVNTTSTPEENKLIIFDGLTYHASTTPTTTPRRVAINFNYR